MDVLGQVLIDLFELVPIVSVGQTAVVLAALINGLKRLGVVKDDTSQMWNGAANFVVWVVFTALGAAGREELFVAAMAIVAAIFKMGGLGLLGYILTQKSHSIGRGWELPLFGPGLAKPKS